MKHRDVKMLNEVQSRMHMLNASTWYKEDALAASKVNI